MRIKEERDILFSEMVRMKPEEIVSIVERISKAIEGEEAARVCMSLSVILLILLQKYDITYTDVLGMADCMVFPSAKNFMITPEFEDIAKKL
jgi:hypothetical protein